MVTASGIDWANNLTGWLVNKPSDSTGQLVAEQHVYNFNTCGTVACFTSQVTPVAAVVPVVWGEYGEDDCGSGSVAQYLPYADVHISAAEAWTWDTWGNCI